MILTLHRCSLKYINVAMVTILKNVTNILTAIGEYYVFRKRQKQQVWTAMLLMVCYFPYGRIAETFGLHLRRGMLCALVILWTFFFSFQFFAYCWWLVPFWLQIISAISAGITDLSFDATGYAWQSLNCVLTASYSVCRIVDYASIISLFHLCYSSHVCIHCNSSHWDASWTEPSNWQNQDLLMKLQWCSWTMHYLYHLPSA